MVGGTLSLTGYESFVNWHPHNVDLLLEGFARAEVDMMSPLQMRFLFQDVADAVGECGRAGGFQRKRAPLPSAAAPADLRAACAQRLRAGLARLAVLRARSPAPSSSTSSSSVSPRGASPRAVSARGEAAQAVPP